MVVQPVVVPAEVARFRNSLFRHSMKTRIIILTKFPEAGKVKSRLAKEVGNNKAAEIYKTILLDNWQIAKDTGHEVCIEFSPLDAKKKFQTLFGKNVILNPQIGTDIGWRMANAFARCLQQQFDAAILIGGDAPDLSAELLNEALVSLLNHDIVLGPTHDGGYYLIGFTKDSFNPHYFQNIDWSSPNVFKQTAEIIRESNNKLYLIEKRFDLDTFDDVKEFLGSSKESSMITDKIRKILENEDFDEENSFNVVSDNTGSGKRSERDL